MLNPNHYFLQGSRFYLNNECHIISHVWKINEISASGKTVTCELITDLHPKGYKKGTIIRKRLFATVENRYYIKIDGNKVYDFASLDGKITA